MDSLASIEKEAGKAFYMADGTDKLKSVYHKLMRAIKNTFTLPIEGKCIGGRPLTPEKKSKHERRS
jgi:hypothetical protein